MHQTELLTVAKAARMLGCSRWTIVRRINHGDIPAQKLGDATSPWLVDRATVERLAAELRESLAREATA